MKLFGKCIGCGDGPLDSANGDDLGGRIHKECQRLLSELIKKQGEKKDKSKNTPQTPCSCMNYIRNGEC